jgi:hypothetical protein
MALNQLRNFHVSLRLLKHNLLVLILCYIVITLLFVSGGYLLINARNIKIVPPFALFLLIANLLIIVFSGLILEMKDAIRTNHLKMRFWRIFTPWTNLKKYTHINTCQYWMNIFCYYYAYNLCFFFVAWSSIVLSFVSGDISIYMIPIVFVVPIALFQMFFIALPFSVVLVPTDKPLYFHMLYPTGLVRYSWKLVKPYKWKVFLFYVIVPWVIIYMGIIFFDYIIGHKNSLLILAEFTLIPSLLMVLYFFFMASWVIHRMAIDSDQKTLL